MELLNQITRTKIFVPRRRQELFSRQRLVDLLYNLMDHRLILTVAPPGYGKTSLLVDFAAQSGLPFCWYALDTLDRDLQRFLLHFIAAIHHRFPEFGQRSGAVLQSMNGDLDLDRLVTTLVNEIYDHIREYFVIVLDDYHLIDENREIRYFINQFVQQVGENCHLAILSRSLISLPDLPLMVARSQVGGLSFEELAFRPEEIQALVLQNHHLTMPRAEAETLVEETEGWITGLLLSTQNVWQGMTDRLRLARVSGVGLYDYLAQQVLDQQPASVRDFLLRTSVLEEFDAELCEAVLGPPDYPDGADWPTLIEAILRSNLFVVPVEDDAWPAADQEAWVRYHHLFRDFLQTRLGKERPREKRQLLRRLAEVHTTRRAWEKAHDLYRRLNDPDAAAGLIEQAGLSLVREGRFKTLAGWLETLPPKHLKYNSFLCALQGIVDTTFGEVEQGLSLLNRAVDLAKTPYHQSYLARALVWRAVAYRFLGKYHSSLADADEVLALTEEAPDLQVVRAEALRARGMSLYNLGRVPEAIEWLEQSLNSYDTLGETQNVAILSLELGMTYGAIGSYRLAELVYQRALDYWRRVKNITWQANLLNNLGVFYHLRGEYEQATVSLEEALACAKQSSNVRAKALALASIGDLYIDVEAFDAGLEAYEKAYAISEQINERFLLFYLNVARAALARLRRDFRRAEELLDAARQLAQTSQSAYELALSDMEAGRQALARDRTAEALVHLEQAANAFRDGGQRVEGACACIYWAAAHRTAENEEAALKALRQAFEMTAHLESDHALVVAGRAAKPLLQQARDDRAIGRQAARLLDRIACFEEEIPQLRRRLRRQASAVPFAPPRLVIQAMSQMQVTLNGTVVTSPEWRNQRKVRELFFYLLTQPRGVAKEVVGAVLWPDSGPSKLKLQFKNAIYRLRSALGKETVILDDLEERYYFNRAIDYEYDVEMFWHDITAARAADDPDHRVAAYRAAARAYKSPYLPEIQETWVLPERERLQRAFFEAVLALADLHLEAGEHNVALEYCRQALAHDSCLEEAHRLAMRAYAAMGNRAAVVRQFERCQTVLLDKVSAPPSTQTATLYESLTG